MSVSNISTLGPTVEMFSIEPNAHEAAVLQFLSDLLGPLDKDELFCGKISAEVFHNLAWQAQEIYESDEINIPQYLDLIKLFQQLDVNPEFYSNWMNSFLSIAYFAVNNEQKALLHLDKYLEDIEDGDLALSTFLKIANG